MFASPDVGWCLEQMGNVHYPLSSAAFFSFIRIVEIEKSSLWLELGLEQVIPTLDG